MHEPSTPANPSPPWWRGAVIYQIWPRSFSDSDGDGIGDLAGVISKLDHISDGLGGGLDADGIWLSPFYESPLADFGYDISDHTSVDPTYGSIAEFDRLVEEAHRRSLRVLLDLVPNHTSLEHPWFEESRSSRSNPKRDWYVWRDPAADGGPPNNWWSAFGAVGSAWTFDQHTRQYYLHSYTPDQPDLDWENPDVREALKQVMRFWLDRGVDGFRIDVVHRLAKDPMLRDNPDDSQGLEPQGPGRHDADWETIGLRLADLRSVADEYDGSLLVGEAYVVDQARIASYIGHGRLHLAHNFEFLHAPWTAEAIGKLLVEHEAISANRGAWCLGNHDHQRIRSRFGPGPSGTAQARAAAVLLLGLAGTVFLYQGDELGLPDTVLQGSLDINGRDPVRTPIPWARPSDVGPGAGFTTGTPWLPLEPEAEKFNAAAQEEDPGSMLSLYRHLIALRRSHSALRLGNFVVHEIGPAMLVFDRVHDSETVRVVVNFAGVDQPLPPPMTGRWSILASSDPDARGGLAPYEARWMKQES